MLGMTVNDDPVNPRNVTGTCRPGYGLHTISVIQTTDTRNDHATPVTLHALQGNKVEWKKEMRHRGRRA